MLPGSRFEAVMAGLRGAKIAVGGRVGQQRDFSKNFMMHSTLARMLQMAPLLFLHRLHVMYT